MSFLIKDDEVQEKYEQIWDVKNKLGIKFHIRYEFPIYEEKYLKAKTRKFDGVIKADFLGDDRPKKICIIIDLLA